MMLMAPQQPGGPQNALNPIPVSSTAHFSYLAHPQGTSLRNPMPQGEDFSSHLTDVFATCSTKHYGLFIISMFDPISQPFC